jgi:nucleoside-diphosphate-sugar epimerase
LGLQGNLVRSATRTSPDRPQIASFAVGNIGPDTDWSAAVTGCDAVVHLAAHVHVMRRQAGDAAGDFHRVNVEGSENLARQGRALAWGDVKDESRVIAVMALHGPRIVFHAAISTITTT